MKIDINKIASLAKLSLTEKEKASYEQELGKILDHVSSLQEVDTKNVPATNQSTSLTGRERDDKIGTEEMHARQEELLNTSQYKEGRFIKVPPVF